MYSESFACGKKGCKGTLVAYKIIDNKKESSIKVLGKCPECKKAYEISLSRNDVASWKPFLQAQFVKCMECGYPSLKTIKRIGDATTGFKIKLDCLECNKDNERYVDGSALDLVESALPSASRTLILCPTCGDHVANEHEQHCPKCGRELYCTNCHATLTTNAKFCPSCGDPVKLGDFSKRAAVTTKTSVATCPTCGASMAPTARFCNECGQEVLCNKCGNRVPPGAVFCNSCGDPVKAGKTTTGKKK
ncbi:MAG: zinc ribbon domain-containing protein [Candidatus Lokiarchaeota archaeon]|nr:zinc ribbon domain-containing protein [Candidatus Lokiarchaeota archaeon]